MSKEPDCSYEVWLDGSKIYGASSIPPTDIDDLGTTFIPARAFESELKVVVRNLSESSTRTIHVQPIGWEEV